MEQNLKGSYSLTSAEKLVAVLVIVSSTTLAVAYLAASSHTTMSHLSQACTTCRGTKTQLKSMVTVYQWPQRNAVNQTTTTPQNPSNSAPVGLRGIVFLLPGCHHSALDFWDEGPACFGCRAPPDHRRMVATVLERGYAAVAVSKGTRAVCWDLQRDHDVKRMAQGMLSFRSQQNVPDRVPSLVFGMGSGASIAARLPHFVKIDGVSLSGATVHPDALTRGLVRHRKEYPPTVYVRNERDPRSCHNARLVEKLLSKRGARTVVLDSTAVAVSPDFFAHRIADMSVAESTILVSSLVSSGLLDSEGFFTRNPEVIKWQTTVKGPLPKAASGPRAAAALTEALLAAWGSQESSADVMERAIDFFGGRRKPGANDGRKEFESYDQLEREQSVRFIGPGEQKPAVPGKFSE